MKLNPGLKNYVDDCFGALPSNPTEDDKTKCGICGTQFANVGNLNRHIDQSIMCAKWSMYSSLHPLEAYVWDKHDPHASTFSTDSPQPAYEAHASVPEESLDPFHHILWNLFLTDKDSVLAHGDGLLSTYMTKNNVKHVLAILPESGAGASTEEVVKLACDGAENVTYTMMTYEGHDTTIDFDTFDAESLHIDKHRARRENVLVFCNNGYQRSIPFLCYYLTKYHADEAATISKAIDLVLPHVDRVNFATARAGYVQSVTELLSTSSSCPMFISQQIFA
eukprot:gene17789-24164_t